MLSEVIGRKIHKMTAYVSRIYHGPLSLFVSFIRETNHKSIAELLYWDFSLTLMEARLLYLPLLNQ